jgi:hypothetical protein
MIRFFVLFRLSVQLIMRLIFFVCAVMAQENMRNTGVSRRRLREPVVFGDEEDQITTIDPTLIDLSQETSDQWSSVREKFLVRSFAFVISAMFSIGIVLPILVAKGLVRIV